MLFSAIFTFIHLLSLVLTQPFQSYPLNMQSKTLDLYTTPTLIGSSFTYGFDNSLVLPASGSNNPIGIISLAKIQFTPLASETFYCSTSTVLTTSISIGCTIANSTITKLSYNYLVSSRSQVLYSFGSGLYLHLIMEQFFLPEGGSSSDSTGTSYGRAGTFNNFNSNGFYKGYSFIRGIQHNLTSATFALNATLKLTSTGYLISCQPSALAGITKAFFSIIIFDNSYFELKKNTIVSQHVDVFQSGLRISDVFTPIDPTVNLIFFGLKSVDFNNSNSYFFSFFMNSSNNEGFPTTSFYNEVQYISFVEYSCPSGQYLERSQKICKSERNGCTTYYETIQNASSFTITGLFLHKSMKVFVLSSAYEVKIFRYNSTNFVLYTSFLIAIQTSTIMKLQFSDDLSRIAIMCQTLAFFVYSWNGTMYIPEYMLSSSQTFSDFSVRDDFKMITILTTTKRFVLQYDNQLKTYKVNPQMDGFSTTKFYINYDLNEAYFLQKAKFYHMNYNENFKFHIPYQPILPISEGTAAINSAISGNLKVIAIDYYGYIPKYGIKIMHYNQTERKFIFHSKIKPVGLQNFGMSNSLRLSYDGLKLAVKAVGSSTESIILFERNSTQYQFAIKQVIGNQPYLNISFTNTSGVFDTSNNLEMIVSAFNKTNVILYYCPSVIQNIANLQQITAAQALFTIVPSQMNVKLDNLAKDIKQIKNGSVGLAQFEEKNKQIKNLVAVALVASFLSVIIILGLGIAILKILKGSFISSHVSTQGRKLEQNSASISNLKQPESQQISENPILEKGYKKSRVIPQFSQGGNGNSQGQQRIKSRKRKLKINERPIQVDDMEHEVTIEET